MSLRKFKVKRTNLFLFAVALTITIPGSPAHAQDTSAGGAAGSKSAQQVALPVTVRDKKGELVPNLQKSDLTLTQDGRPQNIASLTRDTDAPIHIGLLVDTSRSVLGAIDAERKAVGGFLDQMLPADAGRNKAFLIHFDREVELLEDFTGTRDKLHSELDDMGPTAGKRDDSQGPETTGEDRPSHTKAGDDQLYDAIYLAADELMKNQDGRKLLVIFSNGADHGSRETMNDAVDAADRAGLTVYTVFFKGEKERDSYVESPGSRRGGISIPGTGGGGYPGGYPGGGSGKRQPEPKSGAGVDGKKIMQEIASRTGGHAYEARHTSDLEPIYKLIADEVRGQYLLAYTPDKPDDEGGFHKVAVSVSNRDWSVTAPEGYYAPQGKQ